MPIMWSRRCWRSVAVQGSADCPCTWLCYMPLRATLHAAIRALLHALTRALLHALTRPLPNALNGYTACSCKGYATLHALARALLARALLHAHLQEIAAYPHNGLDASLQPYQCVSQLLVVLCMPELCLSHLLVLPLRT